MLGALARGGDGHGHPADWIDLGPRLGHRLGCKGLRLRAPQLDDLRQEGPFGSAKRSGR